VKEDLLFYAERWFTVFFTAWVVDVLLTKGLCTAAVILAIPEIGSKIKYID